MAKSTTMQPRNQLGPKPTGIGTPVQVRLQPDLLDRLDEWRAQQRPIPSRPEAIRGMVEATLTMLDKGK